jgi:hypothetical protein
MGSLKKIIGWYCPFSLSALLDLENVEPVKIIEKENNHYIGTTRLCIKLTAIQSAIGSGRYHGIIVPVCCNLSQSAGAFFQSPEPSGTKLFFMELPRKKGPFFSHMFIKMNEQINTWVQTIESGQRIIAKDLEVARPDSIKNNWCKLAENGIQTLSAMKMEVRLTFLMEEIICPRFLLEDRDILQRIQYLDTTNDSYCTLQSYYSNLLNG